MSTTLAKNSEGLFLATLLCCWCDVINLFTFWLGVFSQIHYYMKAIQTKMLVVFFGCLREIPCAHTMLNIKILSEYFYLEPCSWNKWACVIFFGSLMDYSSLMLLTLALRIIEKMLIKKRYERDSGRKILEMNKQYNT